MNKKMVRTIRENKALYLGTLFLITLSCLLFTAFNQLTVNMTNLVDSFQTDYVQEDASFVADKQLTDIRALEEKFNLTIEETRSLDYSLDEEKTLRLFSQNTKVNIPAVIEGQALSGEDILIDPAFAKANNLEIGDTVHIFDKALKISGYMSLPNYIYPVKNDNDLLNDPNRFGIAVINKDSFQEFQAGSIFYGIKVNSGDVEDKIAQLKDYLKDQGIVILKWTNISENSRVTTVLVKIEGQKAVASSVPAAILILTCILTGVVMWRMLKKEFAIIGTLYALGYRKKEIMKHYLMYPLSIAVTGGFLGTILGSFTVRPLINLMVIFFNLPVESVSFSFRYVVISILLPVIFLGVSGWFVVNRALRYTPVELMKGGREKGKVSFLERRLKLDTLRFSAKFKVREQLRSIPRSMFLLLGVTMATMLLLYGFAAKSSLDFLVQDTYEDTFKYRYQYLLNSLQQGQPEQGEPLMVSPFTAKSDGKTVFTVWGINSNSEYISLKDKTGNKLGADKVIITRPLADMLGVQRGDSIQAVNKLDSREYNITLDEIAETYAGAYIYMNLNRLNKLLDYPPGSYLGLWSMNKIDVPESQLLSVTTSEDFQNAMNAATEPIKAMLGVIALLSFIIGLLVIYVVTSLIIEENKASISLMKVFGYRKKEIYSLILDSSSFLVVIGYALGVPLILAALRALFNSLSESMNLSFPVRIEPVYVLFGFIVIFLTYEISKFLSRKKINRISMAEALKAGME